MEWQRMGLCPPSSVIKATEDYQVEMDALGQWMEECCDVGDAKKELAQTLFSSYQKWCEGVGKKYTLDRSEFIRRLVERGYSKKDTTERSTNRKGTFLLGIRTIDENPFKEPPKFKARKGK